MWRLVFTARQSILTHVVLLLFVSLLIHLHQGQLSADRAAGAAGGTALRWWHYFFVLLLGW